MNTSDNQDLLREYFTNQKFNTLQNDQKKIERHFSNVCDEWFELQLEVKNNKTFPRYNVVGCAITTAAAEALARVIDDKEIKEAQKILSDFFAYVNNDNKKIVAALMPFSIVLKHKSRKKCVLFPLEIYMQQIDEILKGK